MWDTIVGQLRTSARLQLGLGLLFLLVVLAIIHPLASAAVGSQDSGGDPLAIAAYRPWLMPTGSHWLGTDRYGRDILVMSLTGLSASLQVGLIAGLISTAIGVIVAFVGGYKGGTWDSTLRTVTDMFLVIPSLPLLLVLSAYVRRVSLVQVGVMLAIFSWAFAARTMRAHVLSLRSRPYVDLARINDASDMEIIFQELLPNLLPYIGVGFANAAINSIFGLVALEVIGLGPAGVIDLGMMINFSINWGAMSLGAWPLFMAPITLLSLLFMAQQLVNIGLEEVYNPRLRSVAGA
jgi:peptide/nickel transport system permease protein